MIRSIRVECIYNANDHFNLTIGKEYTVLRDQRDPGKPIRYLVRNDLGLHYYYDESCFFLTHSNIFDKCVQFTSKVKNKIFK